MEVIVKRICIGKQKLILFPKFKKNQKKYATSALNPQSQLSSYITN
jgi:hypothetical protein